MPSSCSPTATQPAAAGHDSHHPTISGGEDRIRTCGGSPHTRFPGVPVKPLRHLSTKRVHINQASAQARRKAKHDKRTATFRRQRQCYTPYNRETEQPSSAASAPTNARQLHGGEGGIRTRDPGYPRYRFSRPALSTTQPPLQARSQSHQR